MSESIKRLILGQLPIQACNLKCPYCYISQREGWERDDCTFRYTPKHMAHCLSAERLGGICLINLTAQGETLLYKDIAPLVSEILKQGHYVEIVTNATVSRRIDELLALPANMLERVFFKISYHYSELKRTGLFDRFVENVRKIESSPASFTLELMPHDELCDSLDEILAETTSLFGAPCHATVGRDEARKEYPLLTSMSREQYVETWSELNSEMFDFKMELYGVRRTEFCYAGSWSLFIDMSTGEARQCYKLPNNQNVFADPDKPIKFTPVGYHCPDSYCYNGHSHMAFGLIPEYNKTTYYGIRNRTTSNGSVWLKEPCASFFSHKLCEENAQYTLQEKQRNSLLWPFRYLLMLLRALRRRLLGVVAIG